MFELYQQYLENRKGTGIYRQLPDSDSASLRLDFSTNDYLGLSRHPKLQQAALQAAKEYGVGATGSRLLSGNRMLFETFERQIAQDKQQEAALVFGSGFQTNVSVLASLLNQQVLKTKPIVFFDRLNHASLYQAVFLSGAELVRYRHLDYGHLSTCLKRFQHDPRPKFIVTETLFGMDGDIVSLSSILELARTYTAFVYLDEAHAVGLLGERGYGLSTTMSHDVPSLVMGTFSKAIGCAGGYIACDLAIKNYLINKAEGFIYSTASSPMVIGAALKAWMMIPSFHAERKRLFALAEDLRKQLSRLGFNTGTSLSHIVPVMGSLNELLQMQTKLYQAGIAVSLVRPPTVPPGEQRIRLALNSSHTALDIDYLIRVLQS